MKKKLIVAAFPVNEKQELAAVLYENDSPVEFRIFNAEEPSILGNIYVGKIEKIQKSLNAAFVRYAPDQNGYLPLTDADKDLKAGDEIAVQIEKEALKMKLPRLTRNLTIPGQYIVVSSGRPQLNFSHKLSGDEKIRLKRLLAPERNEQLGCIVRTNAAEASDKTLLEEMQSVSEQLLRIMDEAAHRTIYTCLYHNEPVWERMLQRCSGEDLVRFVTDQPDIYERALRWKDTKEASEAVFELYSDTMVDLFRIYNMTTLFQSIRGKQVWLKSGGFLVIEQTEAFTAVDVNTGRYNGNKTYAELVELTNREAAVEIARQIRLRQISGMILVDFINTKEAAQKEALLELMREQCKRDPVQTTVVDFTALNIMEITRKKTGKSLQEQVQTL
ncbi:MAG: ribonuclease E/G [Eubacteriales bacterium]|nr:ribonuclease E/G [Eubacteriales bacterium]